MIFTTDEYEIVLKKFRLLLKELKEEGYSQQAIGTRINRTQGLVSHMKQEHTNVSSNMIILTARAFGKPLHRVFPDDWLRTPAATNAEAKYFYLAYVCAQNKKRTVIPDFIKFGITKDRAKRILRLQDKSAPYWHEYAVLFEFSKPHIAAAIETVFQNRKTHQGEYVNMSIEDARRLAYDAYNGLAKPIIHEGDKVL